MASKNAIKKRKLQRECWDMDYAFYNWMREHLKTYLHDADKIVDLEYYKFNFRDKEYTQKALILRMMQLLDETRFEDKWDNDYADKTQEIRDIWAMIAPCMWW